MKWVLLIGAGAEQAYAAEQIKRLGYGVLCTDKNPQAPGFAVADEGRVASIYDVKATVDAALELARGRDVVAVMPIGVDVPFTAARVAEALGCPHMPLEACRIAQAKPSMHAVFEKAGIRAPAHLTLERDQLDRLSLEQVAETVGFPAVVKPADSRGARGVSIVRTPETFLQALSNAQEHARTGTVLIEEFLEGPQISAESIIVSGRSHIVGYFDRNYPKRNDPEMELVEDGAQGPSTYSSYRSSANKIAETLARHLNINFGIIKMDLVIHNNKLKIIEFALRMSGGYFGTCAVKISTGIDLIQAALLVYQNQNPPKELLETPDRERGACIRFWFTKSGRVREIRGLSELRRIDGLEHHDLFTKPGDELPAITSMADRRGVVVTGGDTREEAVECAEQAIACVRWVID